MSDLIRGVKVSFKKWLTPPARKACNRPFSSTFRNVNRLCRDRESKSSVWGVYFMGGRVSHCVIKKRKTPSSSHASSYKASRGATCC